MDTATLLCRQLYGRALAGFRQGRLGKKSNNKLRWLKNTAVRGYVETYTEKLPLPDPGTGLITRYYLFVVDRDNVPEEWGCLNIQEWQTATALSDKGVLATVYSEHGRICSRNNVYFHPYDDKYIVAIEASAARVTLGTADVKTIMSGDMSLYLRLEGPANVGNQLKARSFKPTTSVEIQQAFDACKYDTCVFINGRPFTQFTKSDIKSGYYVDSVYYPDALLIYEFAGNALPDAYVSPTLGANSYIIHIPKTSNPDRRTVPYSSCELFAFSSASKQGRWLPMSIMTDEWLQLTFNDFTIPVTVVSQMLTLFPTGTVIEDLTFNVLCRSHVSNSYNERTAEYVDLLYEQDDADIADYLAGVNLPADVDFWSATVLETAVANDFINGYIPDPAESPMVDYISALGYNQALAVLCPRVQRFHVNSKSPHTFPVELPAVFSEKHTKAHVFLDGLKLEDALVTVRPLVLSELTILESNDAFNTAVRNGHRVAITVDESVGFATSSSELLIELFEDPDLPSVHVTPEEGSTTVAFDPDYMELYRVNELADPDVDNALLHPATTLENPFTQAYEAVNPDTVGSVHNNVLEFDSSEYGNTFLVQSRVNLHKIEHHFSQNVEISDVVAPYLTTVTTDDSVVPIVDASKTVAYLNGHALVEGVDYTVRSHIDDNGWVMGQLILQNVGYLQEEDNVFEIYTMKDMSTTTDYAFTEPEYPYGVQVNVDWHSALSVYTLKGKTLSTSTLPNVPFMQIATCGDNVPGSGKLASTRRATSFLMETALQEIEAGTEIEDLRDLDNARLTALKNYYGSTVVEDTPQTVVLEESHDIYSVFIHTIVKDILTAANSGEDNPILTWILSDDYTRDRILTKQLGDDIVPWITAYDWVKDLDLVLDGDHQLDLRFVDVYPSYQHMFISTAAYRARLVQFVQDLVWLYIDTDSITEGDIMTPGYNESGPPT